MCGKEIDAYVGKWAERKITVKCGNTRPDGYPWLCNDCENKHAGRDWRREAEENGENFDSEY